MQQNQAALVKEDLQHQNFRRLQREIARASTAAMYMTAGNPRTYTSRAYYKPLSAKDLWTIVLCGDAMHAMLTTHDDNTGIVLRIAFKGLSITCSISVVAIVNITFLAVFNAK
jgi:hypothetical protein